MNRDDLIRKLNQLGCELARHGGNTIVLLTRRSVGSFLHLSQGRRDNYAFGSARGAVENLVFFFADR